MVAMKRLSREKTALAFFALLVVVGLGALGFYIASIGHSWNVAASNIDDATGQMNDYTAILYEGVVTQKKDASTSSPSSGADASATELNEKAREEGTTGQTPEGDELTASEAVPQEETDVAAKLTVDSLKRSYVEKDASVFVLDVAHPEVYKNRTVIRAGKYSFGVFSLDETNATREYAAQRVGEYKNAKVDFIIMVASDLALVEKCCSEVDIVISTKDEGLFPMGVTVDDVFYNDAALTSEVGTILVSPSKVISAKDVSTL